MSDATNPCWTASSDPDRSAAVLARFVALRRELMAWHGLIGLGLVVLLDGYLRRLGARLASLLGRIAAGRVRPSRAGSAREGSARREAERPETAAARARLRFAGGRGWLRRAYGLRLNIALSALERFLDEPEVRALLAREPGRARRLLRPLDRLVAFSIPIATVPASARQRTVPFEAPVPAPAREVRSGLAPLGVFDDAPRGMEARPFRPDLVERRR